MLKTLRKQWTRTQKIWGRVHCVSDALKFPIFDKKILARAFGLNLAGLAAVLSVVAYPTHAFEYDLVQSGQGNVATPVVMTTKTQYQFPLEMTIGMSQGFYGLHPGVDLRAPKGTQIFAVDDGVVVEVEAMTVGYGHFVRIAHAGTISSLYAHLDQVRVQPGQKVVRGQTLGTVGVTGWTTGPHLHFEIHDGERAVNPLNYISANR